MYDINVLVSLSAKSLAPKFPDSFIDPTYVHSSAPLQHYDVNVLATDSSESLLEKAVLLFMLVPCVFDHLFTHP